MFFDEKRIISVRQMILSKTLEDRKKALDKTSSISKKLIFLKFLKL